MSVPIPGIHARTPQRKAFWEALRVASPEEREALLEAYHQKQQDEWRVESVKRGAIIRDDEARMDACELREPAVRGLSEAECVKRRICYRCGKDLPKGSRRWCSQTCDEAWWTNHGWTSARSAALMRDEHQCVRCGDTERATCGLCGVPWPCDTERHRQQYWRRVRTPLEVNHREPRVGKGYHNGCHNHLDNLESLCHPCHVAETTAQIRSRLPEKPAPAEPEPGLWDSVA